ncbi:hypothetical protein B9Y02_09040 [Acinetobacter baumannii]|nr:hypothetical protein B9Y02_09040 [Acinetobacter baumannii]OTM26827.1 hypothetical protein B9X50_10450 [Acinetobacter baumannii]OTN17719.1 hypothetical protein B9Y15_17225 [Acinetobacter baumannii]OTU14140.1 hypothetical protein CAT63_08060 [Acinetobacter baumannii]OZT29284.1 hypothetical protein CHQ89_14160 [Acinetobacter baumannii]
MLRNWHRAHLISLKSLTYGVQFRTGGGHLRVCWILWLQSANPLSFRHHYLAVMWWNFFIAKGVRYAY